MWKSEARMFPFLLLFFSFFTYGYVYYFYDKRIFETVTYGKDWITMYKTQQDHPDIYKKFKFTPDEDFKSKESKLVLMWYPPFATADSPIKPTQGCHLTYDRSVIEQADAVIFHCAELPDSVHQLPQRRKDQRWIWWCMEPPWNTRFVFRKSLTQFDRVFNWTMTYRLDSDILSPYGDVSQAYQQIDKDWSVQKLIESKTASSLGAWVVSNCAASKRREIIDELSKFISIEIFGKCTGRPLCRPPCMQETLSRYKFYFSFENSECQDYITEKFWRNALESRTLPVVIGGKSRKDYEKVVPPKSFIHVNDFETVEELGKYLQKLARDDAKYARYFTWKTAKGREKWKKEIKKHAHLPNKGLDNYYRYNRSSGLVGICNKLLYEQEGHDVVDRLDQWWYGQGYTEDSTKFSVCHVDSGPSGRPLGWLVTLIYSCFYFVIIGIVWWQCSSRIRKS